MATSSDISTRGLYPKAWIRRGDDFILLKDGGTDAVRRELAASRICQCFDFRQVVYTEGMFEDEPVTESRLITSKKYSIVSKMAFDIFAVNNDASMSFTWRSPICFTASIAASRCVIRTGSTVWQDAPSILS